MNRTPIVGLKKFRFDDRRCGFLCVGIAGVVAGPRLGTPATLGVAGVGVGTDFVSLTTLWRAYRRQRYRSWSCADAEGAFCVVCVQLLALGRRCAQQASLLGQVLDCRRRRECTQWCWSASVWQLGAVEEGLCGVVPPKDWQVGTTEGTLWALPVLACPAASSTPAASDTPYKPTYKHPPTHQNRKSQLSAGTFHPRGRCSPPGPGDIAARRRIFVYLSMKTERQ